MLHPQGTAALLALHESYIEKVNAALQHGNDGNAIELASDYASELGLIRRVA
ncbi:MAG: hypothetical protein JWM93_26 [Frankiales bacterium]|nr:hypothetical protein [Frankiales bacterium]